MLALSGVAASMILGHAGLMISKRIVEPLPKRGMLLIGFSGVSLAFGFGLQLLYAVLYYTLGSIWSIVWLSWGLWIVGSILLHFGFTLPVRE
jgi:hypothetical protein